jgi:uroporphyrinogen-III synthase
MPLWTVGQASTDVFEGALIFQSVFDRLIPALLPENIAKSAKELVPRILAAPPRVGLVATLEDATHVELEPAEPRNFAPYLLIRGDKSLEEIPAALKANGREVEEVTVYSTSPRPDLAKCITSTFEQMPHAERIWLCFFSPSSASFALSHIPADRLARQGTRIFAIGETTRHHLEGRGIRVDAVADRPNPDGLLEALRAADRVSIL